MNSEHNSPRDSISDSALDVSSDPNMHHPNQLVLKEHPLEETESPLSHIISRRSSVSRRITGAERIFRRASTLSSPLPRMGEGKDYPPELPERLPYEVLFDGPDDPTHPFNWSWRTKFYISFACCITALAVTMGSAMFAAAQPSLMYLYNIGWTTSALATSLFVFGFASGPIIWGPLSEVYGRKTPLLISNFGFVCFSFAVATGKDIQTILICRFFAGFIGAAPLVIVPAIFADLFNEKVRSKALAIFAMALFGGPMIAPLMGGFTVKNDDLGWRWTGYFIAIVGSLGFILCCFIKETFADVILMDKAEVLRRRTGIWGIYAPHEEVKLSILEIAENQVSRPIKMLFTEPILFLISLYNAFVYGLLYMFLTAIPLIFTGTYGWSAGVGELPYIAMFIGSLIGGVICFAFEFRNQKIVNRTGKPSTPEAALLPIMVGSISFTIGIFWLGWAGGFGPKVHWIVPTLGAVPIGIGLITIFLPCLVYIIDCYFVVSASAVAGNTFLRSSFGAAFPLFSKQMFENMKIKWASTMIGCIAAVLIPVPFLFYRYGPALRRKSQYCAALD